MSRLLAILGLLLLPWALAQRLVVAQGTDPTTLDAPLATDSPRPPWSPTSARPSLS
jgi:hypothetical protein